MTSSKKKENKGAQTNKEALLAHKQSIEEQIEDLQNQVSQQARALDKAASLDPAKLQKNRLSKRLERANEQLAKFKSDGTGFSSVRRASALGKGAGALPKEVLKKYDQSITQAFHNRAADPKGNIYPRSLRSLAAAALDRALKQVRPNHEPLLL